jgi:hypothetical protein
LRHMVLLALDVICSAVSGAPDEDFVVLLRRFHPSSVMYVGISSVGPWWKHKAHPNEVYALRVCEVRGLECMTGVWGVL